MFDTLALILFLFIGVCSIFFFCSSPGVPYGLYHLKLNKGPEDSGPLPKTEWMNQGYWKVCFLLTAPVMILKNSHIGDNVIP
jgi:hypothetical protein